MRSHFELENQDFSLCILLAAMSVESTAAALYFKWKSLDRAVVEAGGPTESQLKAWDKEYSKLHNIESKLNAVSRITTNESFDDYASHQPWLREFSITGPSCLRQFYSFIFEPRNAVVHRGNVDLDEKTADRCLSAAIASRQLLDAMDLQKRKVQQMEWKA